MRSVLERRRVLGAAVLVSLAMCTGGCAQVIEGPPPSEALTLRELLALSPQAVRALSAEERGYWRHRIDAALNLQAAAGDVKANDPGALPAAPAVGMALPKALRVALAVDTERRAKGLDPIVAAEMLAEPTDQGLRPLHTLSLFESENLPTPTPSVRIGDAESFATLEPELAAELLPIRAALANVAPADREIVLFAAPAAPFALLYSPIDSVAYVNPVLVALRDDYLSADDAVLLPRSGAGGAGADPGPPSYWGDSNPYDFYDSIAECVAAERARCDNCMAGADCRAKLGGASGVDECAMMASTFDNVGPDAGIVSVIGYDLACIAYALSISAVEYCVARDDSNCIPASLSVDITNLETYRPVFEDPTCIAILDECLGPPSIDAPACDRTCESFWGCDSLNVLASCTDTCDQISESCSNCSTECSQCGSDCATCSDSCSSSDCSCAVTTTLPPPPLNPQRPAAARPGTLAAARSLIAVLLPPLFFLWWRRRMKVPPAGGGQPPDEGAGEVPAARPESGEEAAS